MELREWANDILSSDTLEGKLVYPDSLTDREPGSPIIWREPARPPSMKLRQRGKNQKLPPFQEHGDKDKRAVCLHRFAGHELMAVEIMAYTLLAFPDAPPHFRKGLANTLREEQGHVRLYMEAMEALGIKFGDLPLYNNFWTHTPHIISPLHYISIMSLTFEMANLDFAPMYGKSFAHFGDHQSAQLMATILKDEISHVSFGLNWLKKFKKEGENEWDVWSETIATTLLKHKRAKGFVLHEKPRQEAGIPQDWIDHLKKLK